MEELYLGQIFVKGFDLGIVLLANMLWLKLVIFSAYICALIFVQVFDSYNQLLNELNSC